jgi:transcriptional regulator with XRE-family HTH domain
MSELADLLRTRRNSLRPADLGLPEHGRRRTPGLRREEVAQLAGISTTYYTFLEQGRHVSPSRPILDALARALRLTPAEREHLHALVHGPQTPRPPEVLVPGVEELVAGLDPHPAYVSGRHWDVLAANKAACALWTDWSRRPPAERNILWWTFADPKARTVLVEWEAEARAQLARFRAAAARHPDDPAYEALLERLRRHSKEVREWWRQHDVAPLTSGRKILHHPDLGRLDLGLLVLQVADDPEQKVVTFRAAPEDAARIGALIGSTRTR